MTSPATIARPSIPSAAMTVQSIGRRPSRQRRCAAGHTVSASHHVRILILATQALLLLELDVEAEAADLVAQHVEGHGGAGLERVGALDHGLVDLRAALD